MDAWKTLKVDEMTDEAWDLLVADLDTVLHRLFSAEMRALRARDFPAYDAARRALYAAIEAKHGVDEEEIDLELERRGEPASRPWSYPKIGRASDAYSQGKSAYQRGNAPNNPFPGDFWEHSDWQMGWHEAREAMADEDFEDLD